VVVPLVHQICDVDRVGAHPCVLQARHNRA
jgi:hypothetical protein